MDSDWQCNACNRLLSQAPVFSFLTSCLHDPLAQFDSLRLFMEESPTPLQTSQQCKAEEASGGGGLEELRTSEKLGELRAKATALLGGWLRG